MNQYIQAKQGEWQKTIDFFKKDIMSLRTGRANPAILEGVRVEVYGAKSPVNSLANIAVRDGSSIMIVPWDKNTTKEIEKAIVEADLGVNVINEGGKIRITIPQMTEESRQELVKKLNAKQEKARISIRQVRDEIKEEIEKAEKKKEISEDDKFRFIKELDEEARKINDDLKAVKEKKEEEVMTI